MRMMMRVTIPVESGNKAIKDDTIGKTIQQAMEVIKPEAAYFTPHNGQRTAYFFFDMKDSSQLVQYGEQFFLQLNAQVEFVPAMNAEDLKTGLATLKR